MTTMLMALTGCWDSKPVDKRLLPLIMGVDLDEEKNTYIVSLRIPDPLSGSFYSAHAEAYTFSEALDRMRMNEERSIDLLHVSLVLVSEALAKKGIEDITQYIMRARELKSKVTLAVVRGNVAKLISDQSKKRKESSTEMLDLFNTSAGWTPNIALTHAWEVYRDILSPTADIVLPIINKGTETMFQMEGSALFHNDRMVGFISSDETMLYNLFHGRFISGIVEVTESASLQIVDANVKNQTSWEGGSPKIKSTMELKAIVLEAKAKNVLDNRILKRELEQLLEKRFQLLFIKIKQEHSDILMTGVIFRKKLTQSQIDEWENQLFPKLVIDFRTVVDIRNTGDIKMRE
ncbi:Ger(x)C family spore germination protein [Paenibacillus sp. 2TAB26]|uniref:Ger(x)C family spore germination protein n=1 Tax=Paenibacillus sp. 2TAB26 TaxID=3233005 RepID=UPI003F95A039